MAEGTRPMAARGNGATPLPVERLARVETRVEAIAEDVHDIRHVIQRGAEENTRQHRENQAAVQGGFQAMGREVQAHVETLHTRINRQFRGALLWVLGLAGTAIVSLLGAVLWLLSNPLPWHPPG